MPLHFPPKSEDEIAKSSLAPTGIYDFDVLSAVDEVSKSGNPMITIKLGLYFEDKVRWHVTDYLLAMMEAKLRHFCDAVGLLGKYEAGTLSAEDCKGRSGKVKIVIDDRNPNYPPKNAVRDYVARKAKSTGDKDAPSDESIDDVPF